MILLSVILRCQKYLKAFSLDFFSIYAISSKTFLYRNVCIYDEIPVQKCENRKK